jgi:uncharacterized protein with GYD domain
MPRYLSLFKYTPEGRKGFMKEKAAAREAALKLTIEGAGGKLELFNWTVPEPIITVLLLRSSLMLVPTRQLFHW